MQFVSGMAHYEPFSLQLDKILPVRVGDHRRRKIDSLLFKLHHIADWVEPQELEVLKRTGLIQQMFVFDLRVDQKTIVLALVDSFIEVSLFHDDSLVLRAENFFSNWELIGYLELSLVWKN